MEKLCRKCNRLLPLAAFPVSGHSPCRQCRALRQANWYARRKLALRAQKRAYMRAWRARHPGYDGRKTPQQYDPMRHKVYKAKYRANNRERINAAGRDYYQRNRARILAARKRRKLMRVL